MQIEEIVKQLFQQGLRQATVEQATAMIVSRAEEIRDALHTHDSGVRVSEVPFGDPALQYDSTN